MSDKLKSILGNETSFKLGVVSLIVAVAVWITNSIWAVRSEVNNVRSDVRLLQKELDDFKENGSGPIKEVQRTVNQLTTDLKIHMGTTLLKGTP